MTVNGWMFVLFFGLLASLEMDACQMRRINRELIAMQRQHAAQNEVVIDALERCIQGLR